jgi:hypothetical protein
MSNWNTDKLIATDTPFGVRGHIRALKAATYCRTPKAAAQEKICIEAGWV